MTRTEEVDAAIERAGADAPYIEASPEEVYRAMRDRRLLAEEVGLLRESVRGLQEDLRDAGRDLREMEANLERAERLVEQDRW